MESSIPIFWFEKLISTILTYSIVLIPIAFIVVTTKFRLCPSPLQSSLLIQWFVFGRDHSNTYAQREDGIELIQHEGSTDRRKSSQIKLATDKPTLTSSNITTFCWCFVGLQLSYLTWGVLQEKIMTTKYVILPQETQNITLKSQGHMIYNQTNDIETRSKTVVFHDSQFLVFVNRIVAFIVAIIALVTLDRRRKDDCRGNISKPQAPLYEYIYSSLSNILSSWCQYEALKYVNFPTQVLSKACKLIPVMLMSKLISRKRYSMFDYLCAIVLSAGMSIFLLFQDTKKSGNHTDIISVIESISTTTAISKVDEESHVRPSDSTNLKALYNQLFATRNTTGLSSGLAILALYLTFDSFTSNWQGKLFSRYRVTSYQMMAASNFYSVLLTVTSLVRLGDLQPAFQLLASSNKLFIDCAFVSITSAVGQLFVYYTIRKFGPVVFTVIMTSRQLIAILLSCTLYEHNLGFGSIIGLLVVFFVVFIQIGHKLKSQRPTLKQ